MKTADKKKTASEPQKVIVANFPKPRPWWKEYALVIAFLALCVSIYSAHLTRKEYIVAHRPYVHATSRRSDNGDMDLNSVIVHILNAPARIVNQEICYVAVTPEDNGNDHQEIKYSKQFNDECAVYPSGATRQITVLYDFNKELLATDPNITLRRKVRIEYREFSTSREYFYEGYWDYSRKFNVWQDKNVLGN